jgi:hypothetical protein
MNDTDRGNIVSTDLATGQHDRRPHRRPKKSSTGSTYKRCGCTDPLTGHRLDTTCPQLLCSDHGSWYFFLSMPATDGHRQRLRRGGYDTERDARHALHAEAAHADAELNRRRTTTSSVDTSLRPRPGPERVSTVTSAAGHKLRDLILRFNRDQPVPAATPALDSPVGRQHESASSTSSHNGRASTAGHRPSLLGARLGSRRRSLIESPSPLKWLKDRP